MYVRWWNWNAQFHLSAEMPQFYTKAPCLVAFTVWFRNLFQDTTFQYSAAHFIHIADVPGYFIGTDFPHYTKYCI